MDMEEAIDWIYTIGWFTRCLHNSKKTRGEKGLQSIKTFNLNLYMYSIYKYKYVCTGMHYN